MKALLLTNEYPPHVYGGAGVHVEYLARELAHLPADAEVSFPDTKHGIMQFLEGLEASAGHHSGAALTAESLRSWSPIRAAAMEALGPFAPLAAGERTVAAMPFRLEVR